MLVKATKARPAGLGNERASEKTLRPEPADAGGRGTRPYTSAQQDSFSTSVKKLKAASLSASAIVG